MPVLQAADALLQKARATVTIEAADEDQAEEAESFDSSIDVERAAQRLSLMDSNDENEDDEDFRADDGVNKRQKLDTATLDHRLKAASSGVIVKGTQDEYERYINLSFYILDYLRLTYVHNQQTLGFLQGILCPTRVSMDREAGRFGNNISEASGRFA